MAFNAGETRPWRRRREAARDAAEQARAGAGDAFLDLDSTQRDLRLTMETLKAAALPTDAAHVRDAQARFAQLGEQIDAVSAAYIDAMDRHRLEGELEAHAYETARRELDDMRGRLVALKRDVDAFAESVSGLLGRSEQALAQLVPTVERARQAVAAAHAALETARRENLAGPELLSRASALDADAANLAKGAAVLGLSGTIDLAGRLTASANTLRDDAEKLPRTRDDVKKRLSSLRTRAEAIESRSANVEPALSVLRRGYSTACWNDLDKVPQTVRRALATAHDRLGEASRAAAAQEWADAVSRLATARSALTEADDAMAAVHDRVRALEEVARDPDAEFERTRFAIRDAQRLALAGGPVVDPRYAQPLDALVERLEGSRTGLDVPHPDWWRYLSTTTGIRTEVAAIVQRIRDDRAGR